MFDYITRFALTFFSASAILAVGVILLMLSVPFTNEWKKFRTVRLCLALTCFVMAASNFTGCVALDNQVDTLLFSTKLLIVASYQAMLFTTASLVFVQSSWVNRRNVFSHLAIITATGASLLVAQFYFHNLFPVMFGAGIVAYIVQIILYTMAFRKDYERCIKNLEAYYDEDETGRMRWIKLCFYSALIVGIVALYFCIIPYSSFIFDLFVWTYTIYYIYIAGCVINYRIKAGFIVNAKTVQPEQLASGTAKEEDADQHNVLDWAETLRIALQKWVADKKFIEMDANPDKVAKDLGTTKALLNSYFSKYEHITFREWRTQLRIKEAERFLSEEEDVVVSSLHELVGVSDKSNFRKHFKQLTGMTPSEYRKQFHK